MNKIKKIIAVGLIGLFGTSIAITSNASNNFTYAMAATNYICCGNVRLEENKDGTYKVTHVAKNATEIIIPAEYNGIKITNISKDTFKDCQNQAIDKLTIPAGVTIAAGTFVGIKDIENFNYEGDFDTFYKSILPELWKNKDKCMPTHITVDGTCYLTDKNNFGSNYVYYYKDYVPTGRKTGKNYSSFGYYNGKSYKNSNLL